MTIDITKITPEKLAEMNDTLLLDNTHLRGRVAAQLAELEAISAALGTNEGHSSVTHIEALRQQLKEAQQVCLDYDRKLHDAQYAAMIPVVTMEMEEACNDSGV